MVVHISSFYGLDICVILEFIHWNLTTKAMVLGSGAIGRWLGRDALLFGPHALTKEAKRAPLPFVPHEDSEKVPSVTCGVGSHQTRILPMPWFWTPSQKCEKELSVVYKLLSLWCSVTAAQVKKVMGKKVAIVILEVG